MRVVLCVCLLALGCAAGPAAPTPSPVPTPDPTATPAAATAVALFTDPPRPSVTPQPQPILEPPRPTPAPTAAPAIRPNPTPTPPSTPTRAPAPLPSAARGVEWAPHEKADAGFAIALPSDWREMPVDRESILKLIAVSSEGVISGLPFIQVFRSPTKRDLDGIAALALANAQRLSAEPVQQRKVYLPAGIAVETRLSARSDKTVASVIAYDLLKDGTRYTFLLFASKESASRYAVVFDRIANSFTFR